MNNEASEVWLKLEIIHILQNYSIEATTLNIQGYELDLELNTWAFELKIFYDDSFLHDNQVIKTLPVLNIEEYSTCVEDILIKWVQYCRMRDYRNEMGLIIVSDYPIENEMNRFIREARLYIAEEHNHALFESLAWNDIHYVGGKLKQETVQKLNEYTRLKNLLEEILSEHPLCTVTEKFPIIRLLDNYCHFQYYGTTFRLFPVYTKKEGSPSRLIITVTGISNDFRISASKEEFERVLLEIREFQKFPNLVEPPWYHFGRVVSKVLSMRDKAEMKRLQSVLIEEFREWENAELVSRNLLSQYHSNTFQRYSGEVDANSTYYVTKFHLDNHYFFFVQHMDVVNFDVTNTELIISNEEYPEQIKKFISLADTGIM